MEKNRLLLALMVMTLITANAQKIDKQGTYSPESLKKDSYLGNVEYNVETKETSLQYVEKSSINTIFTTYKFDEELKFIDETSEKYTLTDAFKDDWKKLKEAFSWFEYEGDVIESEFLDVKYMFGGKLEVSKTKLIKTYNWKWGWYNYKYDVIEKKEISGLDGGRIVLYDRYNNLENGEIVMLIGNKPPKGEMKGRKFEQCRKFQILKIKNDLTLEYGEKIEFEYNYGINFSKPLTNEFIPDSGVTGFDISKNDIAIYMSPIKSILSRKFESKTPGKHKLLILNSEGKITSNVDIQAPSTGWVIEDLVVSNSGKDIYFYGPSKDDAYISALQPMNSPLTANSGEPSDIKYKSFQIMKITDGAFAWINATPLTEFKAKSVTPPSQKKAPQYIGKNFVKSLVYISQKDEIIIAGQKYSTKNIPKDPTRPDAGTVKVIDNYKDLVMFHFDNKGVLKAQYGIRREKNNKYAKAELTPQDIVENESGSTLYWIYGEIQGMRQGFSLGGGDGILDVAGEGTLSKRKLLYYPAVAKISLEKGIMGDFVSLGAVDGKQIYYTNPEFPHVISSDFSTLTFIGEDKKGSLVWMAQMKVE